MCLRKPQHRGARRAEENQKRGAGRRSPPGVWGAGAAAAGRKEKSGTLEGRVRVGTNAARPALLTKVRVTPVALAHSAAGSAKPGDWRTYVSNFSSSGKKSQSTACRRASRSQRDHGPEALIQREMGNGTEGIETDLTANENSIPTERRPSPAGAGRAGDHKPQERKDIN